MSMTCQDGVIDARLAKTKIMVFVDDVPRHVVTKSGGFVVVKTAMSAEVMAKLPFLANEEFANLEEALEEAGRGAYHRVSWSYDDGPFKAVFKGSFKLGTWLATTYGITARRWENETTGETGISFKSQLPFGSVPFRHCEIFSRRRKGVYKVPLKGLAC